MNTSSKFNGSLNRTQLLPSQGTPRSQLSTTEILDKVKLKEELKQARPLRTALSRRKSRSRSHQDPDAVLAALWLPLKVPAVFKQFGNFLSKFEQMEILDFGEIWYLGMKAEKVTDFSSENNYGFDDERNDYKVVKGDHIAYRFEVLEVLGKGSFGQVLKCFDHKSKAFVAVKVIRNQKRFHRQGKVEVKVLNQLKNNDNLDQFNCVKMHEYFVFRKHICITFELLSMNLYELLKANNFNGFSLTLVRRFAVQILTCLNYIKENNVIHCDLKPENILLKDPNKSGVKVIDFGSSCLGNEKIYTYIQSRFYRAPEIILGIDYTTAIDMWSLGCILGEIHSGYPVFPGECEAEQLLCIMEVKGLPPEDILENSSRRKLFFDGLTPKIYTNSRGKKRLPKTRNLADKVKSSDEDFLDFLEKCFDWDPASRLTPVEAFNHKFITDAFHGHFKMTKSPEISKGDGNL
jgi:serine/threonine protein kinase